MAKLADLLSVEDARNRILNRFQKLGAERVPLLDALGRVLADDILSAMNLPPFTNSSMDGFALQSTSARSAEPGRETRLKIVGTIAAGSEVLPHVGPGECARIMTGAPLPPGADSVVPFEDVREAGDELLLSAPVTERACVRPAGQDVSEGQLALSAGTVVDAPQLALLASLGHASVRVVRRPLVALLSTGDELIDPGESLGPGQIYNSNTPMLLASLREAGASARRLDSARDDPGAIREAARQASGAQLLITTGGASVGDYDYVKDIVGEDGELAFWRVRVRPGKPLIFGSINEIPLIGLPGNPTSAMVTFEQFVRPAVRVMLGLSPLRPRVEAVLDEDVDNGGGRRTYARVKLRLDRDGFHASLSGAQDSAMLLPLAHADGLLEIPEDRAHLVTGDRAMVDVWRLPG